MNEYVSLDPEREMQKYWSHIAKLLETIRDRAAQLGLTKQNIE